MTFDLHPAVEGPLDAAVVHRISVEVGANCLNAYGMRGKDDARVPLQPEEEADPKRRLANLATHSRSSRIREGIAPRAGSGRDVGPEYNSALSEFIQDGWSIQNAIQSAPSLAAAMECLRTLAKRVEEDHFLTK